MLAEVDHLEVELLGQRAGEVALVQDPRVDEVLAEALAAAGLASQRVVERGLGQQRSLDEHLPEPACARGGARCGAGIGRVGVGIGPALRELRAGLLECLELAPGVTARAARLSRL